MSTWFKWTRSQMSDSDEEFGVGPVRPASRRRRWSEAERLRIVAESYQPGLSVSLVVRRNDVNANLLFTWRRRYGKRAAGAGDGGLVPVVVEPAGPAGGAGGDRHGLWAVGGTGGDRAVGWFAGDRRPRGGRPGAGPGSCGPGPPMIPVPGGVRARDPDHGMHKPTTVNSPTDVFVMPEMKRSGGIRSSPMASTTYQGCLDHGSTFRRLS